jgi:hypothetical protein
MAKTFYYDSVGLLESTLNDGTFAPITNPTFSDASTITNEERAIDQSISTAMTSFGVNDALQFNLGSAKAIDFIGVNFTVVDTHNLELWYDTAASGVLEAEATSMTADFPIGWTFSEFSSATKQYWTLVAVNGTITGLSEVIMGSKLAFEVNPDIGIGEQKIFGTDINTSIGGVEYAIKRHDPKSTISMNFSNISETFKNNLQTFESHVQNYKKFVYSEDGTTGNFHYVRLDAPIQFQEVAFQRYSASLILREQLS